MAARRRLRDLRKSLHVTQGELSAVAGITKQAYSQLEAGKMAARPERMTPMNKLLRQRRGEYIEVLKMQIKRLESFDIDESLYLKE